jgi:protein gp37
MSDTFHEKVPDEAIDRIFAVMALSPQHTFMVLTKRADRMREYVGVSMVPSRHERICCAGVEYQRHNSRLIPYRTWPLPNVWLGVSVEDRSQRQRIDQLRETPAALRFLSLEPLIEDLGELDLRGIGFCILGGESGPGARPMRPDWARSARDQCVAAGVPFFFKQWGEWEPGVLGQRATYYSCAHGGVLMAGENVQRRDDGAVRFVRVGKRAAGRLLDGQEWNELPEARR